MEWMARGRMLVMVFSWRIMSPLSTIADLISFALLIAVAKTMFSGSSWRGYLTNWTFGSCSVIRIFKCLRYLPVSLTSTWYLFRITKYSRRLERYWEQFFITYREWSGNFLHLLKRSCAEQTADISYYNTFQGKKHPRRSLNLTRKFWLGHPEFCALFQVSFHPYCLSKHDGEVLYHCDKSHRTRKYMSVP